MGDSQVFFFVKSKWVAGMGKVPARFLGIWELLEEEVGGG